MRVSTCDDPQSLSWGGAAWSGWHDFDQAHSASLIPTTSGLYRFRARGDTGLLYIGESGARKGRRSRLGALARGTMRHSPDYYLHWRDAGLPRRPHRSHYAAPYLRQCRDAGCRIEVSWSIGEFADDGERLCTEDRLIGLHQQVTGWDPPVQHGGRGMDAYLTRHMTG